MTSLTTFYLSRLIGCAIFDARENILGKISDVYVIMHSGNESEESHKPRVVAFSAKIDGKRKDVTLNNLQIIKFGTHYKVQCQSLTIIGTKHLTNAVLLKSYILDKQIVDITGRKLVRVNDIRMVSIPTGTFVVAVDVGTEGLLRRIGIDRIIKHLLIPFKGRIPSKFILWDEVETVNLNTLSIQLSTSRSKLNTLHPSDLADIIEDLGTHSKTQFFSSLDEEQAADVLEELDIKEQVHIIENLPIEKAADVLEKMPANEAADLMDYLEEEKAELLLHEMDPETSEEVRDLLEYPDSTVGSLMTTDIISFDRNATIQEALNFIRNERPEMESLYCMFVTDNKNRLEGTITMRDLLISSPSQPIAAIMNQKVTCVNDYDKLDSLSELVSKYNLLAVPVTNETNELEGMVVVDDIIDDLLGKRRTT